MNLSEEQKKIVEIGENRPALVIAIPGSGKSTTLIYRIHELIRRGTNPERILAVTFTKEAAGQMKEKYDALFGISNVDFRTIHSLCFDILQKTYSFSTKNIVSEEEKKKLFFRLIKEKQLYVENKQEFVRNLITEISYIRNRGIRYTDYKPINSSKSEFQMFYSAYLGYKQENKKIDFDDMLWSAYRVLLNPQYKNYWQSRYDYILVDEYQDTNRIQANIFYVLAEKTHNLLVVGDDDQSCYRFRGAEPEVFFDFQRVFPDAVTYYLSENYRSKSEILNRADLLIRNNKKRMAKVLHAYRGEGGIITPFILKPDQNQCLAVVNKLMEWQAEGYPLNEVAVLYRTNSQNQLLIGELMKNKIPFFTTEAVYDYHNHFIFKDIMAYYRLSAGKELPGDLKSILNSPTRYIKTAPFADCRFDLDEMLRICDSFDGYKPKDKIMTLWYDVKRLRDKSPSVFLKFLMNNMDYKSYIPDHARYCHADVEETKEILKNLQQEAAQFETMEQWISYTNNYARELEKKKKEMHKDGVCLSTLHSAKGLEWGRVLIIGCNDGTYPHERAESEEDLEEERRLFYVGVTRAKDECYLYCTLSGSDVSPYLKEMKLIGAAKKEDSCVDVQLMRKLRLNKNYSINQIAAYLRIPSIQYAQYEDGVRPMPIAFYERAMEKLA